MAERFSRRRVAEVVENWFACQQVQNVPDPWAVWSGQEEDSTWLQESHDPLQINVGGKRQMLDYFLQDHEVERLAWRRVVRRQINKLKLDPQTGDVTRGSFMDVTDAGLHPQYLRQQDRHDSPTDIDCLARRRKW